MRIYYAGLNGHVGYTTLMPCEIMKVTPGNHKITLKLHNINDDDEEIIECKSFIMEEGDH